MNIYKKVILAGAIIATLPLSALADRPVTIHNVTGYDSSTSYTVKIVSEATHPNNKRSSTKNPRCFWTGQDYGYCNVGTPGNKLIAPGATEQIQYQTGHDWDFFKVHVYVNNVEQKLCSDSTSHGLYFDFNDSTRTNDRSTNKYLNIVTNPGKNNAPDSLVYCYAFGR